MQVPMLSDLNLSDNLMGKIPFVAISNIKSLKKLDLSNNRIEKIEDPFFPNGVVRLDRYRFILTLTISNVSSTALYIKFKMRRTLVVA